jgi:hypothetical protein
MSFRKNVI